MYRHPNCPDAVARICGGTNAPCLSGQVRFYQECGSVLVVAEVTGFSVGDQNGFFALHIHEGDSCCGEGFPATGGHYNPKGTPHPDHAGDLPPLLVCDGRAYLAVRTGRFRVSEIIGRTVVIHGGSDDFHSQPAGNAGAKIACGVICRS